MSDEKRPRDTALDEFTKWFVKNYPGPVTIISDPQWHAPKIFRAVENAQLLPDSRLITREMLRDLLTRAIRYYCDGKMFSAAYEVENEFFGATDEVRE